MILLIYKLVNLISSDSKCFCHVGVQCLHLIDHKLKPHNLSPHQFPSAAIINYQKLHGVKRQKYIPPQMWRLMSEIKMSMGRCFLRRLQRKITLFFEVLVTPGLPWFGKALLQFLPAFQKASSVEFLFSLGLFLPRTLVTGFRTHLKPR